MTRIVQLRKLFDVVSGRHGPLYFSNQWYFRFKGLGIQSFAIEFGLIVEVAVSVRAFRR